MQTKFYIEYKNRLVSNEFDTLEEAQEVISQEDEEHAHNMRVIALNEVDALRANLVDKLKHNYLLLENISEKDLKETKCKTAVHRGMDTNTFWLATQEGIILYTEQEAISDDTNLSTQLDKTMIQKCTKNAKSRGKQELKKSILNLDQDLTYGNLENIKDKFSFCNGQIHLIYSIGLISAHTFCRYIRLINNMRFKNILLKSNLKNKDI